LYRKKQITNTLLH